MPSHERSRTPCHCDVLVGVDGLAAPDIPYLGGAFGLAAPDIPYLGGVDGLAAPDIPYLGGAVGLAAPDIPDNWTSRHCRGRQASQ